MLVYLKENLYQILDTNLWKGVFSLLLYILQHENKIIIIIMSYYYLQPRLLYDVKQKARTINIKMSEL